MLDMYPGIDGSKFAQITSDVTTGTSVIYIDNTEVLPDAPNLLVMFAVDGNGMITKWERCKFVSKYPEQDLVWIMRSGDDHGSNDGGIAQSFSTGDYVARLFTNRDFEILHSNIDELSSDISDLQSAIEEIALEGTNSWVELTDFISTPVSTSEIETTSNYTSIATYWRPVRWDDVSIRPHYGYVSSSGYDSIHIYGENLAEISKLYIGSSDQMKTIDLYFPGEYATVASNHIFKDTFNNFLYFPYPRGYFVRMLATHEVPDSGASQPVINLTHNGTNDALVTGITLQEPWELTYDNPRRTVNFELNDYEYGNLYGGNNFDISVIPGTNGDAEGLRVTLTFIVPS